MCQVMLGMWVVGVMKVVKDCDCLDNAFDELLAKGSDACCDHSGSSDQILSKLIIQFANAIDIRCHG